MYNIAFINQCKQNANEYIEKLDKTSCFVQQMEKYHRSEELLNKDAVIILENSINDMSKTCEVILAIRNKTKSFIWILSENSTKMSRIVYLQMGADCVFDSSIDAEEFGVYVRNSFKRVEAKDSPDQPVAVPVSSEIKEAAEKEMLELVPNNFSVKLAGKGEIGLTKLEYRVLDILIQQKGEAITHEELYLKIWGTEVDDDVKKYRVSNLIFHLRKKLGEDSFNPHYIKTVRSRGYMLTN